MSIAMDRPLLRGHRHLLMFLLVMILCGSFVNRMAGFDWVLSIMFTFVMLASVRTISAQPRHFWPALILAFVGLIAQFGADFRSSGLMEGIRYVASSLLLFWISSLLLRDVILRSREVTQDLLFGAVNIYLLVGFAFAFLYGYLEYLIPGTFAGIDALGRYEDNVMPFAYFSFVTMTTLGYGDLLPQAQFAATLAVLQAVFGQFYLAILVARLVGLHVVRGRS